MKLLFFGDCMFGRDNHDFTLNPFQFVSKFIKQAEQEHIKFEDFMRARKNHRLELQREEIKQTNADKDILKKLEDLNELYKSGVLTKEEFEKAKAKVLN